MVLTQWELQKRYIWQWWTQKEIQKVTIRPNWTEVQIRPKVEHKELCFTANEVWSTVKLVKYSSPTSVTLEMSTDGINWSSYSIGSTITLNNIWDKVYLRNTSETTTWFSLSSTTNLYKFSMTWQIKASWDVTSLINKNCTDTLVWNYCFAALFGNISSLITPPKIPATTLTSSCYYQMFVNCSNLESLPELPATTLTSSCYRQMFQWCSKIKLSTTQTWEYQTEYRIPTTWTWTTASNALNSTFTSTWWTFTWTPSINTTYYTSNTLV